MVKTLDTRVQLSFLASEHINVLEGEYVLIPQGQGTEAP
jgi:hypothetical protein